MSTNTLARTHYTAWFVNDSGYLDQPNMDVTVLQDMLIGADPDDDGAWSCDIAVPAALYAVTSVNAKTGDTEAGLTEAADILRAADWVLVGDWAPAGNAYTATVVRV